LDVLGNRDLNGDIGSDAAGQGERSRILRQGGPDSGHQSRLGNQRRRDSEPVVV
jgi:hypothetical protein